MIKFKLVKDTLGADYNGEVAIIRKSSIDSIKVESRFEKYPICVKIYVRDVIYRVRLDDFKENKKISRDWMFKDE